MKVTKKKKVSQHFSSLTAKNYKKYHLSRRFLDLLFPCGLSLKIFGTKVGISHLRGRTIQFANSTPCVAVAALDKSLSIV